MEQSKTGIKVHPAPGRVLLKMDADNEVSEAGLRLPAQVISRSNETGVVVEVGPPIEGANNALPPGLSPGMRVAMNRGGGYPVVVVGEALGRMVYSNEILGVVEGDIPPARLAAR